MTEDQEECEQPKIDFVPAVCFVPRGKAKERPDKVEFSREELARILSEAKAELTAAGGGGDEDAEGMDVDGNVEATVEVPQDEADEYGFENYDADSNMAATNVASLVEIDENAPDTAGGDDDEDDDSEAEDEIIKPTDNLVLVGRVQDEAASMEVWVFNSDEHALYTHHEFFLPSFPLCIEWLTHDPGAEKPGNLCAIGSMDPIITVWDLDIQDSLEPTFKLGSKASKKNNRPGYGHRDAVLDLSWNINFEHVLASASVDRTVLLWDLDVGQPHTVIEKVFGGEAQTLEFHPTEAHSLLTGCADSTVRLFDCRATPVSECCASWHALEGTDTDEVEKVVWHPKHENYFIYGTRKGFLHYADRRQPNKLLWSHEAHLDEISGVCFNRERPKLLTTTSADGMLKIWKIDESSISGVYSHDFDMGRLQCMRQSPEDPFTLAIGGEKAPNCTIYNIKNFEAVRIVFGVPNAE